MALLMQQEGAVRWRGKTDVRRVLTIRNEIPEAEDVPYARSRAALMRRVALRLLSRFHHKISPSRSPIKLLTIK
jgi:hypothetical protein